MQNSRLGLAYIYFNYRERYEHNLDTLLEAVLRQICLGLPKIPEVVEDLYKKYKDSEIRPQTFELAQLLSQVAQSLSRLYIVVDALDECNAAVNCRHSLLTILLGLQDDGHLNLFATSRDIAEITEEFEGCLMQEIRASEHDIRLYLDYHLHPMKLLLKKHPELEEDIKSTIVRRVDGM